MVGIFSFSIIFINAEYFEEFLLLKYTLDLRM